jgi:FkbM family methyltransferase
LSLSIESLRNGKVYIYGSGSFSRLVFRICGELGVKIEGFVDHLSTSNDSFRKVLKVSELPDSERVFVLLGVCNLFGDLNTIVAALLQRNSQIQIISPVLFAQISFSNGIKLDNYWLTGDTSYVNRSQTRIEKAKSILSDQKSKDLVDQIIRYRLRGQVTDIPEPENILIQYLPLDLPTPPMVLRMLELGSFRGEDMIRLSESGRSIETAFCFEPDLNNFRLLVNSVNNLSLPNVYFLPIGAYNQTGFLQFSSDRNSSARVLKSGAQTILAMNITEFLGKNSVNYIKMDIEGAESEALDGLENVVKLQKPHMAICVYHKPEDLWELPLKVHGMVPNSYDFFLRTYGHQTFDTILYCIPKKAVAISE